MDKKKLLIILSLIVLLGAFLRFYNLGKVSFVADEFLDINSSYAYFKTGVWQNWDFNQGTVNVENAFAPRDERAWGYKWQVAQLFRFFAPTETTARAVSASWGILTIILRSGIVGSAIATTIASFLVMSVMLFYLRRDFGVAFQLRSVLRVALAGFHIYIFSLLIPLGSNLFILESLILLAVYFGFLWILREIKKEDLSILQNIIARKKASEVEEELSGNEPSA